MKIASVEMRWSMRRFLVCVFTVLALTGCWPFTVEARQSFNQQIQAALTAMGYVTSTSTVVQWSKNFLLAASGYVNFGSTTGVNGYGIRDNAGTVQFKNSGNSWVSFPNGGTAPSNGKYLIQTADASLPNAQAMSALVTGFVINTTASGVQVVWPGSGCPATSFLRTIGATGALTCSAQINGSANTNRFSVGSVAVPTTNTLNHLFVGSGTWMGQEAASGETDLGWNFYYNSGFKYRVTDFASKVQFVSGTAVFSMAASGSADAAISWVDRLVLSNAGALTLSAYGAGTLTSDASGNITSVSDERMKDRIAPLPYGLDEVMQLRPIQYGYNAASGLEREHLYGGFSAQNVLASGFLLAIGRDERGFYTLNDRPILSAVVNAVQHEKYRLDDLDARLRLLESRK